ncbi:MAG: TetR/AcrR family transcriptional regulator [Streptomycetaceae bacterium]|nr:TetR/AcrR family transcriptional regulator [Streptomycetaceae bacterium]
MAEKTEAETPPTETTEPTASPRRRELLAATRAYAAQNNLSDLSLRPLAAAIGSSPRVLLYLFGSKEGLIREVLAAGRAEQLALVERASREADGPREVLELLWVWLTDRERRTVLRLFFEGYIRGCGDEEPWQGFALASVDDWLPPLEGLLAGRRAPATLVLAVMRGLLLDWLADDAALGRVNQAWEAFLDDVFGERA